jgi:hypothetical protein
LQNGSEFFENGKEFLENRQGDFGKRRGDFERGNGERGMGTGGRGAASGGRANEVGGASGDGAGRVSKDGGEGKERLGKQEALVTSAPRPRTHPPVPRSLIARFFLSMISADAYPSTIHFLLSTFQTPCSPRLLAVSQENAVFVSLSPCENLFSPYKKKFSPCENKISPYENYIRYGSFRKKTGRFLKTSGSFLDGKWKIESGKWASLFPSSAGTFVIRTNVRFPIGRDYRGAIRACAHLPRGKIRRRLSAAGRHSPACPENPQRTKAGEQAPRLAPLGGGLALWSVQPSCIDNTRPPVSAIYPLCPCRYSAPVPAVRSSRETRDWGKTASVRRQRKRGGQACHSPAPTGESIVARPPVAADTPVKSENDEGTLAARSPNLLVPLFV